MKTFKYYCDAGHGWVAVKRDLVNQLGIKDKITPYSYQKGNTVYLEEDCDASRFFDAFKKLGIEYYTKTIHCKKDNSPIRNYERYSQ